MVPIGHANDGGGSIRIPASAMRAGRAEAVARARVSLAPDSATSLGGLATELVVSRSVRDTAAVLDASEGAPPGDPYFGARPRRAPTPRRSAPTPAAAHRADDRRAGRPGGRPPGLRRRRRAGAARTLESLGHSVEVAHPVALDDEGYIPQFLVRWTAGVAPGLDFWSMRTGRQITAEDVEPLTWALAEPGRSHSAAAYLASVGYAQIVSRRRARLVGERLRPAADADDGRAARGARLLRTGRDDNPLAPFERAIPLAAFTAAFNATGQPAISLPLHCPATGLPIGVQLVADCGREDLLMRVASQVEQAQPWAERRPPTFATA